jgi:hypothetical protein
MYHVASLIARFVFNTNTRYRKLKGQYKMYNPEIQAALGTQDEDKQNKNKHKAETKNNE